MDHLTIISNGSMDKWLRPRLDLNVRDVQDFTTSVIKSTPTMGASKRRSISTRGLSCPTSPPLIY
jgi:hypothetical protein